MPGKRIPPSERISKEIMGIIRNLEGHRSNQKLLGELMQLSMRKLIQELLEKEIQEHIGKAYYEHGDDRAGYRNGYKLHFPLCVLFRHTCEPRQSVPSDSVYL